jgi:hypothetical protein
MPGRDAPDRPEAAASTLASALVALVGLPAPSFGRWPGPSRGWPPRTIHRQSTPPPGMVQMMARERGEIEFYTSFIILLDFR